MAAYASRYHDHAIFDNLRFSGWFDAVAVFSTDEPKRRCWVWRPGCEFGEPLDNPIKGFGFWIPGQGALPPSNGKPCFVVQSLDPKGTLFAPWNEKADDGATTEALKGRRDCIVLSAGTGYPLADERSIVQGDFGFTAVNVGSIERAVPIPGRDRMDEAAAIGRNIHSFLVISVYGTTVEIERRDYVSSRRAPVGPVWTFDIGKYGEYEYAKRAKAAKIPQFASGAKVTAVESPGGRIEISFPPAAKGRAYEYEITARHSVANLEIVDLQKRDYSPGFADLQASGTNDVRCSFQRADLTWDVDVVIEVRPLNCFGGKGAPICGGIYLESPGEREVRLKKEVELRAKAAKKGGR